MRRIPKKFWRLKWLGRHWFKITKKLLRNKNGLMWGTIESIYLLILMKESCLKIAELQETK